jgi:manganese-dependent inorganic pyrophosphatase
MAEIYVTGHRSPDLDSVASAIGYAELKRRLDRDNDYVPVRLGEVNAQTAWALERSGAPKPIVLPHIRLRVQDVMHGDFTTAAEDTPLRDVGLTMAHENVDLVPIVDAKGALVGLITERDLAHLYIRESRGASTFSERPAGVASIVHTIEGELLVGEGDRQVDGRLWVLAMDVETQGTNIEPGDIVVVGDRADAQRAAIELGVAVLVTSNDVRPDAEVLELARERGTAVVISPLDSYVTSRMIQLAVPSGTVMTRDVLTASPGDLLAEVTEAILDMYYRAAIVVDDEERPIGIVSRRSFVNPRPRRVLLVDHAETAQSVPGVETAEIVEILDHHHIGSIETKVPVMATFDPIGSTATLVVERFRLNGMEPTPPTAAMLLAAILSDTVILSSPTATDRDRAVVTYLELLLQVDATRLGREMFEAASDVSDVSAEEIVSRDAKEYQVGSGQTIWIAQIETVGTGPLLARREELLGAMGAIREARDSPLYALMVTDIAAKGTHLLVSGDMGPIERTFEVHAQDHVVELPGVMSRKKQVAPKLLAAL